MFAIQANPDAKDIYDTLFNYYSLNKDLNLDEMIDITSLFKEWELILPFKILKGIEDENLNYIKSLKTLEVYDEHFFIDKAELFSNIVYFGEIIKKEEIFKDLIIFYKEVISQELVSDSYNRKVDITDLLKHLKIYYAMFEIKNNVYFSFIKRGNV